MMSKTQTTPIEELNPEDKLYIPWPSDREKPQSWKIPEIVTVKRVELPSTVLIKESGGLCLQDKWFQKVIDAAQPEAGDMITFDLDHYDANGFKVYKEHTTEVRKTSFDPMKVHPPKCIVNVDGEDYGIPFSEVKCLEKKGKLKPQLSLF